MYQFGVQKWNPDDLRRIAEYTPYEIIINHAARRGLFGMDNSFLFKKSISPENQILFLHKNTTYIVVTHTMRIIRFVADVNTVAFSILNKSVIRVVDPTINSIGLKIKLVTEKLGEHIFISFNIDIQQLNISHTNIVIIYPFIPNLGINV